MEDSAYPSHYIKNYKQTIYTVRTSVRAVISATQNRKFY